MQRDNSRANVRAMGRNVVVVGTQWGDEGKGKVVDWLTEHAQGVARFPQFSLRPQGLDQQAQQRDMMPRLRQRVAQQRFGLGVLALAEQRLGLAQRVFVVR